jgi:arginyl-tRNA synthetase
MILKHLEELLEEAAHRAREKKRLKFSFLPPYVIEVPRESFGDWASNIAFLLAKEARKSPLEIADILIEEIESSFWVEKIEVGGKGFINFYLSASYIYQELKEILEKGKEYGSVNLGKGLKIQVEFVSANPVGPLHLGHGRWAAVGDSLANLLEKTGFSVEREFYINDYGRQMEIFALSVESRFRELLGEEVSFPEEGYRGSYIYEIAQEILREEGKTLLELPEKERKEKFKKLACEKALADIERTLESMGVHFDVWFSESELHEKSEVKKAIELLKDKGFVYGKEGAIWLKTSLFGDEKDRVLVRENGEPTYFAADIAYHKNKRERGFEKVIDIWGSDHHGYVARMKASMKALGYSDDFLEVIIGQMVNLLRGGQPVRMSKRTGELVTLSELLEEVGKDPVRYFFASRSTDAALDFDIELAKKESSENPVFYIQYAHARLSSLFRKAREMGIEIEKLDLEQVNYLRENEEINLAKKLFLFPYVVEQAVKLRAPYRLTSYAYELASLFHIFYTECRILKEEKELESARLLLARATQHVLQECLSILGVEAPERM